MLDRVCNAVRYDYPIEHVIVEKQTEVITLDSDSEQPQAIQ